MGNDNRGSTIDRVPPGAPRGSRFVEPYGLVTPVRNQRGDVLYYVDSSGSRIGEGAALQGPGTGQKNKYGAPERTSSRSVADRAREVAEQQAKATADHQLSAANQAQGYVWLNGKRMRITSMGADGSITVSVDGEKDQPYPRLSAFDALDRQGELDGNLAYVMSLGTQRGADNTTTMTQRPDGFTSADAADRQYNSQVGKNLMSVRNGIQWLANLSTKDPEAYTAMVDKLHDAGYLNDGDYAVAGGGWSSAVADGFARAARDTAVVNSTTNGESTTLDQLLGQKATANKALQDKLKADQFQPVDRTYTDPTYLVGAAKSAAEAALGRLLTKDEEAKLTAHFRGLETSKFDQIDAAHKAGAGATITDPNPSGQIDDFLNSGELEQEQANFRTAGYGDALRKLVGL